MKKLILAASLGIGAVFSLLSTPAKAQYESFRPPLGYYVDYLCEGDTNARDPIAVRLESGQGGLGLVMGQGAMPGVDSLYAVSEQFEVAALYNERQGDFVAWEYEFTVNNVEDESASTYAVNLLDYWASDDDEEITVTEYPSSSNGRPRAPRSFGYTCRVVSGGVNPYL